MQSLLAPFFLGLLPLLAQVADRPRIRVHGHRGARARLPENTLPAFEYAIQQGADALEMDLAVTRDNVLVVSHDPVLHGPLCAHPGKKHALIRQLTLAEVREWDCGAVPNPRFPLQQPVPGTRIPTLDDVLQLAGRGAFDYNLEIKSFPDHPELTPPPDEFARLVLEKIRYYHLEDRVIVQSFDFRPLVAVRKRAPEIRLSALTENDPREFVVLTQEAGNAEIVAPEVRLVTPAKVAAAHAAGLQVVPWTANTPADWDHLIDANVDAIITDDPAECIVHLQKRRLR